MKVFLSWSGERSKAVAQAMRDWLNLVLHYVQPWMSQHDIAAGERWSSEVAKELDACNFGIVCLTKDNLRAPWLLFEAGALSKQITQGAVVPYLLDVDFADILQSPLGLFQGKKADKPQTLELVLAINGRAEKPDEEQRIRRLFEATWPELENKLGLIPKTPEATAAPRRAQEEILEELISLVRGVDQRMVRVEDYVRLKLPEQAVPGDAVPRVWPPMRKHRLINLGAVRLMRNMSREQLAKVSRLSLTNIENVENGGFASEQILLRIADALQVDPEVLTAHAPIGKLEPFE